MLLSVNGINEQLEQFISENYDFRRNLINKILGKELLEYKRSDSLNWSPVSKFIAKERRHILSEQNVSKHEAQEHFPNWLIERIAQNQSSMSQDFIENKNHLKVINEFPVKVTGVKPVRTSKRESVHLEVGDKCFVSFGVKKSFFRNYSRALPAVVESIRIENDQEFYNVLIVKLNKKTQTVEYFGRHLIMNTEVGKTPEQAVQNVAYSQAIY